MSKVNRCKNLLAILSLSLLSADAFSAYVYEVTQTWSQNENSAVYGTAARIFVTVGNGASTNRSQTYTWADITRVRFGTIGGSFYVDSIGGDVGSFLPSETFLTTDATGMGTLDIVNGDYAYGPGFAFLTVSTSPGVISAQLGAGEALNLYYSDGQTVAYFTSRPRNWTVAASPVPLPAASLLLLSGLAGVGVLKRRKAA